jgi:putative membrane protein (TIGR04086 family)
MSDLKKKKINYNKKNNKYIDLLLKYLPCFFKGELVIVFGILVLTFAYYKISGDNNYLYYFSLIIIALGSFFTGNNTYKKFGGRGIVSGFIGSLPLAFINLMIVLIFCLKTTNWFILLILPISLISGATGGILASNSKKRY